jgi:hypothetical protein
MLTLFQFYFFYNQRNILPAVTVSQLHLHHSSLEADRDLENCRNYSFIICVLCQKVKGKGKDIPVTGHGGP